MIDKVLKNLVFLLYPTDICAWTQKELYFETDEYKRLNHLLSDFDGENGKILRQNILEEFKNDKTLKDFQDFSLLFNGDRCLTFNVTIIENREMYTISLFMSVIVPYYVIKVQKNIIELWFSESKITELEKENTETRKLNELVSEIENIIETNFLYKKFPNKLLNSVISNISFGESMFGYFTMYNAFFNDVIIKENEN